MAHFEPTAQQKRAIDSRQKTIVVSAGAGSGKTAVLAERIVSRLCRDRADIDRFLVVTYTNAAAFEMRSRIADKLGEKISENLNEPLLCEHLRKQIGKLPAAKVQTVHSFCLELVRRNFSTLGLSSQFSIGDDASLLQLRQTAADKTLDDAYACPPEGFNLLRATLCEERGDKKLAEAVLSVFDRLQSLPYPEKWLLDRINSQNGDNDAKKAAFDECIFMLSAAENAVLNVQSELERSYPDVLAQAQKCYDYYISFATELQKKLTEGDTDACINLTDSYKAPNIRTPKDAPEYAVAFAKGVKDVFKQAVSDIKQLLSLPDGGENTDAAEKCLCRLVLSFSENLKNEKIRADIVDFNDLEHFAVKLLSDENGERSPIAGELSDYLCELMVDEYQDSNAVQDTIFSLVAPKNGSAFYVGDIKQSIYRFRKAEARIFAEKCRLAQTAPDSEYIAMDRNFRSRGEVLNVCNYFFSRAMTESFGGVDYRAPGQGLVCGRETEGLLPSELCLIDTPSVKAISADDDENLSSAKAEAEYTAARIKQMLSSPACRVPCNGGNRRAEASDFAILLSSFKGKAPIFKKALEDAGINSAIETEEEDPFGTVEASVIISLLRIISNRRQDIPLLAVLRSPLFFFTPDDLAAMRSSYPKGDLWDALNSAALSGDRKCLDAVNEIEHYCIMSQDMSCAKLLQYIYARSGAYGIFSSLPDPQKRTATLDMLYETALKCEHGSFASCSKLVDHIDRAAKVKTSSVSAGEGVKIMSIHKSKGLEFPFVFVCDLCKTFNNDDTKTNVLVHTDIGLSLRQVNLKQRVRTGTKKRFIISNRITQELRAEEMRKLYVAMTRAREKLFLVVSSGRSSLQSLCSKTFESAGEYPTVHFMRNQTSCAKWLLAVLFGHPDAALLRSYMPAFHYPDSPSDGSLICSEAKYLSETGLVLPELETAPEQIRPDFDPMEYLPLSKESYAYEHISRLPSKITPSGALELASPVQRGIYMHADGNQTGENAAEKGTRVHALLSALPLQTGMSQKDIISYFVQNGRECSQEDAAMIEAFLASDTGKQAVCAPECLREYQFSALLTPNELGLNKADDEHILLNGSIDMLLVTKDGLVIIDFKTDSVKHGMEQSAAEKHRPQLEMYALAAQSIFEQKVIKKSVFFLKTGTEAVL